MDEDQVWPTNTERAGQGCRGPARAPPRLNSANGRVSGRRPGRETIPVTTGEQRAPPIPAAGGADRRLEESSAGRPFFSFDRRLPPPSFRVPPAPQRASDPLRPQLASRSAPRKKQQQRPGGAGHPGQPSGWAGKRGPKEGRGLDRDESPCPAELLGVTFFAIVAGRTAQHERAPAQVGPPRSRARANAEHRAGHGPAPRPPGRRTPPSQRPSPEWISQQRRGVAGRCP